MGSAPVIGVLGLQGDVRRARCGRWQAVGGAARRAVPRPDELDRVDGLVIPGGESTTHVAALRRPSIDSTPLRKRSPAKGCPRSVPALA